MFRFEDFCISRAAEPGVLEIRRTSHGETRWTFRLDVAATYAERFAEPEAFAIDGRLGARGELHLIAHVRDAARPRLLPPRELTISDGPSLDRTRPGADRHALEANRHVIYGGHQCEVREETATSLILLDGRTIAKSESFGGPVLRMVTDRDWSIRIVQELDDHVLAVVAGAAGKTLGWSMGVTDETADLGYRWFERSELDHLEPIVRRDPCTFCHQISTEHAAGLNVIEIDRDAMIRRVVECSACLTTWTVQQHDRSHDPWTWTATSRRERDGKPEIAVVATPSRPAVHTGPEASVDHAFVVIAPDSKVDVTGETTTTITLLGERSSPDAALAAAGFHLDYERDDRMGAGPEYRYTATLDKLDRRIIGPFDYCVRFDDHVLRVANESATTLQLVCHPQIGPTLRFARADHHGRAVSYGWVPRSSVEELRVARDLAAREPGEVLMGEHRSPFQPDREIAEILARTLELELAGIGTFTVDEESELRIVVTAGRDATDPALVQAGFVAEPWREVEKYNLVLEGVTHRLTLDKRDARLRGPHVGLVGFRGAIVRVAARRDDKILIVAEGRSLASQLGFTWGTTHGQRIGFWWVDHSEIETTLP
jgi:hypothetical protein